MRQLARRVREVRAWGEARSASSRTQRRVQRKRKGSPREVNNEVNTMKQAANDSETCQSILFDWAMYVDQSVGIAPVVFADPTAPSPSCLSTMHPPNAPIYVTHPSMLQL